MNYSNNKTLNIKHSDAFTLVSPEQESILLANVFERSENWEAAFRKLVLSNLGLVVKIAHDFNISGSMIEDLISEGIIGLEIAIMRFDPSKGAKLSTYSSWWIKQRIFKHISNNAQIIATPYAAKRAILKIKAAYEELGKDMALSTMAEYTGYSMEKIKSIMSCDVSFISLDDFLEEKRDSKSNLHNSISDESQKSPFVEVRDSDLIQKIKKIVEKMPNRKRDIFCSRHGIFGNEMETLDEIGKRWKLTKERVRQIEASALLQIQNELSIMENAPLESGCE